jgi:Ca-activated chloride channel family protein
VVTGQAAVQASKQAREQQDAVRVDANAAAGVRRVGAKTFYLRDGVWTDSEWKAEARLPETVLVFGSNEYFARVQREPELARYLALGERVVVVFGGRVYRVRAATQ